MGEGINVGICICVGVGICVSVGNGGNVGNAVKVGNGIGELKRGPSNGSPLGVTFAAFVVVLSVVSYERVPQEARKTMENIQKYCCGVNLIVIVIHPKSKRNSRFSPIQLFIPCRCYGVVARMSQFRNHPLLWKLIAYAWIWCRGFFKQPGRQKSSNNSLYKNKRCRAISAASQMSLQERLVSSSVEYSFRVRQLVLPGREDLHGAGLELGDQRLRVEGVVRQ